MSAPFVLVTIILFFASVTCYVPISHSILTTKQHNQIARNTHLFAGQPNPAGLKEETREKIENLIKSNKVVLFMKGNKLFPQW